MLERLTIENFRSLRRVVVPLRPLTVLVGPNDSGKSTFLAALNRLTTPGGFPIEDHWRRQKIDRPLLTALTPIGEFESRHISGDEIARHSIRPLALFQLPSRGASMQSPGTSDAAGPPQLSPDGANLPALLDYLLRLDRDRFDSLVVAMRGLVSGLENIGIRTPDERTRRIELVIDGGLKIDGESASAGLRFLLFFVGLAFHPTPPKTILIEEPETGIHPKRLADVMNLLREITQGKHGGNAAQIILTTHSPYLLDLVNLDTDQVLVFKRNDDGSRTAEPVDAERLKTFLDEFLLGEVWFNQGEDGLVARKTP